MVKTNILIIALAILCYGCKPELVSTTPEAGEIDASHFICIGGNEMAGYTNGALFYDGQQQSLAKLLSKQLKLVSIANEGFDFHQPLMSQNSVGVSLDSLSRLILGEKTDCLNNTSLSPIRIAATGDFMAFNESNIGATLHAYQNWGIPGLKTTDVNTINWSNPFFRRMTSATGNSILDEIEMAANNNLSFFAVYLGVEDVLQYAKNGATLPLMTPTNVNGAPGIDFQNSLAVMLSVLTSNGAKGVISTIPDITAFPYFTAIPPNGLTLDSANLETLNSVYNPIGFSFELGANNFMINDPAANAFGVRPMLENERLLLSVPLDSVKCNKMGSVFPLRDEFVLTVNEIEEIQNRINEYNAVIRTLSEQYDLALVDAHKWFAEIPNEITYNGTPVNSSFASGGAFSLDGITLTGKGKAMLANEFIKAINLKYHSTIPEINALEYNAVLFP